jgi:hypothetical protein
MITVSMTMESWSFVMGRILKSNVNSLVTGFSATLHQWYHKYCMMFDAGNISCPEGGDCNVSFYSLTNS